MNAQPTERPRSSSSPSGGSEIQSQIAIIRDVIERQAPEAGAVSALLAGARRVRLLGAGESYHTAALGAWLFREVGLAALADRSFDLAHYPGSFEPGDLVFALSQEGVDEDAQQLLARARDFGLPTIVLTGANAPRWNADATVELSGAPFPALPAVWFAVAGGFLAALAARLEPGSPPALSVSALPETLAELSGTPPVSFERNGQDLAAERRGLIIGSGPHLPAARALATAEHATGGYLRWSSHHDEAARIAHLLLRAGDLTIELNRAPADGLPGVVTERGAAHWRVQPAEPSIGTAVSALAALLPVQRFLATTR